MTKRGPHGPTESPIIFSGAMVRAILEGRKTQTRRVLNPQPGGSVEIIVEDGRVPWPWIVRHTATQRREERSLNCPYGVAGDRLWVRETFTTLTGPGGPVRYYATDEVHELRKKHPSIFMPRWASRINLEIAEIRVQRVQEISEEDCAAEGVDFIPEAPTPLNHRTAYAGLWDTINAKRGFTWFSNPWVWAITFKVVRP